MSTPWTTSRVLLATLVVVVYLPFLGLASGCQRKCQPSPGQRFRFLSNADWRLVETDNPGSAYRTLSRFTFQVWHFDNTFSGNVKKVENNEQFDTPILTYKWNVDIEQQLLRIKFTIPGSDGSDGSEVSDAQEAGTFDYYYDLGTELTLQEVTRGYTYRFVQMQGIVEPDKDCEF